VNNLTTYLHDHLAGAQFAISLLADLAEQEVDTELAAFVSQLKAEIEDDRTILQGVVERLDSSPSLLKEASAWLTQKLGRAKFQLGSEPFSIFEALEILSLGILGKRALWRALQSLPPHEAYAQLNLDDLIDRAVRQYDQVEQRRIGYAKRTL
jgi:hypothetical protein